MILDHEKIRRITTTLKFHPKGMSITEISHDLKMNRNSVAKYLEVLLISGQVEVKTYGTSKIYTISHRMPVSALMSYTSDLILVINAEGRIIEANEAFLNFSGLDRKNMIGEPYSVIERALLPDLPLKELLEQGFEKTASTVERVTHRNGNEWFLRIKLLPTTFDDGSVGVTIIAEDITESKKTGRMLADREELYRSVLENIQDVYYRSDNRGTLVMASPSWASLLGYDDVNDCIGLSIAGDFYYEPEKRKEFLEAVRAKGKVFDYEVVLKKKDGSPVTVSTNSHFYYDKNGSVLGVEGIFRDITERKEASEKIQNYLGQIEFLSRKMMGFIDMSSTDNIFDRIASDLQALVPDSLVLVNTIDPAKGLITVRGTSLNEEDSRIIAAAIGRDLIGFNLAADPIMLHRMRSGSLSRSDRPLSEIALNVIPESVCSQLETALGISDMFTIGFVRAGAVLGNAAIFLKKGSGIPDMRLVEIYAHQASIALQRYMAEEERRNSDEIFANVAKHSLLPIAIIEPDGTYRYINESFTRVFGYDLGDFRTGREWFLLAFPDPEYRKQVKMAWKADLEQSSVGDARPRTFTLRCKDDSVKEITFNPVTLSDGRQCVIYLDVTERRSAERVRKLLSAIVESTDDAIIGKDIDGTILSWNDAAEKLYQYSSKEIIGQNISILVPADKRREMEEVFGRIRLGESVVNLETQRIRRDGRALDVAVTISPITDENGIVTGASTIARDITQRKAEERLSESEEKYRSLVENLSVGVYRSTGDTKGKFIWGNSSLVTLLGYHSLNELQQVEVAKVFAKEGGRKKLLDELRTSGFVKNRMVHLKRRDGKKICVQVTALARFNAAGEILCINGVVEDITARKDAEDQLRMMHKEIQDIVAVLPDPTCIVDSGNKIIASNASMDTAYGVAAANAADPRQSFPRSRIFSDILPPLVELLGAPDPILHHYYPDARREGETLTADIVLQEDQSSPASPMDMVRIQAVPLVGPENTRIGAVQTIRRLAGGTTSDEERPQSRSEIRITEQVPGHPAHLQRIQYPPVHSYKYPDILGQVYVTNALRMAKDCITIMDLSARCIWMNESLVSLLGAGSSDAVVGKSVTAFIAYELRKPYLEKLSEVRKYGCSSFPFSIITPNGRAHMEASISLVADSTGSPLGYLAIMRGPLMDNYKGGHLTDHSKER